MKEYSLSTFHATYFREAGFKSKKEGISVLRKSGIKKIEFLPRTQLVKKLKSLRRKAKQNEIVQEDKNEDNAVQKVANVSFTISYTLITYNRDGKSKPHMVDLDQTFYVPISYTTKASLELNIQSKTLELWKKMEDSVVSATKIVFIKSSHSFVSEDEIKKHNANPMHQELRSATPINFTFFKGTILNVPKEEGKCVDSYLLDVYPKHIKTLNQAKLNEILFDDLHSNQLSRTPHNIQVFCDYYKITHMAIDLTGRSFHYKVWPHSKYPALIYYAADNHMYPVTDKKTRDILSKNSSKRSMSITTQTFSKKEENDFESDEVERFTLPYFVDIPKEDLPKYKDCNIFYHTCNLHDMYIDLCVTTNKVHKIVNYTTSLNCIELVDQNVRLYNNSNHSLGRDWEDTMKVCKLLDIPFTNQTFTRVASQVYERFNNKAGGLKYLRKNINKIQSDKIIDNQNNKCNNCGKSADKYEIDHIIPLMSGGTNEFTNLQALCKTCHDNKSRLETSEGNFKINNTLSCYNNETFKIFTAKKNAFIHSYKSKYDFPVGSIFFGLDLVKCRKHILQFLIDKFPVFSVLDDPKVYNGEEIHVGVYFVVSDNMLPLKGNGWYSHPVVQYCLDEGIITKEQITHKLIPSLTLSGNHFTEFVSSTFDAAGIYGKQIINSFIGNFGHKKSTKRNSHITHSMNDVAYLYMKNANMFVCEHGEDGNILYEVTEQKEKVYHEGYTPFFNQIIDIEAIELHKIVKLLQSHGGEVVYVNTDNAVAYFKEPVNFDFVINNTFWGTSKIKKYSAQSEPKDKKNKVEISKQVYNYVKPEYTIINDPQHNDFRSFSRQLIREQKSFGLDARGGCGKTTLLKKMIYELRRKNLNVVCVAPTNKACHELDKNAMTLDRFFSAIDGNNMSKLNKIDYLIVDEKSMVRELFYRLLYIVKRNTDIKMIISGDFDQLPPVRDRSLTFDYKNSSVLHELCDGVVVKLTKCRRSDNTHFQLCESLDVPKSMFSNVIHDKSVCYHNSVRKTVNQKYMEIHREKRSRTVSKYIHDKQSQDIILSKGMPLISYRATTSLNKIPITNSDEYTLLNYNKKTCELQRDCDKKVITIKTKEITKIFLPSYCMTIHRSQGGTFRKPYTILEWNKLDDTLKYVALSRASDSKLVHILNDIDNPEYLS